MEDAVKNPHRHHQAPLVDLVEARWDGEATFRASEHVVMLSCEGDWAGVTNSFEDGPFGQIGISGGRIKIIPAGRTIHAKWKRGRRRYMLVFIDPKKLSNVLIQEHPDLPFFLPEQAGLKNRNLENILDAIRKELVIPSLCRITLGNALTAQLIVGLLRLSSHHRGDAKHGALSPRDLRAVLSLIDRRYAYKLSLHEMAAVTGLSQSHFSHAFQQTTGQSPYKFLLERRLCAASDLLAKGILSLTEVALQSGFSGSSHFATAFRRATGASPREWRRQAQQRGVAECPLAGVDA
jgi:AraC-like DNA-binding protein